MTENNNNNTERWLDDIGDKLSSMHAAPSPEVWQRVSEAVSPTATPTTSRRPMVWWRIAAALTLPLVAVTAVLLITRGDDTAGTSTASLATLYNESQSNPGQGTHSAETESITDADPSLHASAIGNTHQTPAFAVAETPELEPIAATAADDKSTATDGELTEPGGEMRELEAPRPCQTPAERSVKAIKTDDSRLAISLYTNSAYGGSFAKEFRSLPTRAPARGSHLDNYRDAVSERWHPSVPITVGATVRYPINDRLGVESGLSYTALRQERDVFFTDGSTETDRNTVHYIGIPVKMTYRLTSTGHFDLYAAAGTRMDVTLSNKNSLSPVADSNNAGDLQWSVCAGAGVQYNAGRLGVYIEPCAGYYFKADGNRPTVYSDYPVVFQIETGIRIKL